MSFPQNIMHVGVGVSSLLGVRTFVFPVSLRVIVMVSDWKIVWERVSTGVRLRDIDTVGVTDGEPSGVCESVFSESDTDGVWDWIVSVPSWLGSSVNRGSVRDGDFDCVPDTLPSSETEPVLDTEEDGVFEKVRE